MNQITDDPILRLENVSKVYKTKKMLLRGQEKDVIALNNLSLDIQRGEIFGLVGESGSGKTTTGRLIVKLEDPQNGKIWLNDTETIGLKGEALRDFRRRVQMIFQDPYQSLNPQISIYDTVSEPLIIHKIGSGEARQDAVWKALQSAGLSPPEDFVHRYPHQLSGGQRQRVAIARTMVLKPDFVVADEPTSMLDASISAQIFNILLEIRDTMQATLLFITHSLAAARYLCDRIAVIYRGNLMELGPAEEVIHNPKHPYTQALLDALPRFGDCGDVKYYGTLNKTSREAAGSSGCSFFPKCKGAQKEKCSADMPPLSEIGPSHAVACFFAKPGYEPGTQEDACFYAT